jgi:hypothetical protein
VLITVERTDYPVEKILHPTVTVCREDNDPNRFELTAKLLDTVKFPCFDNG